MTLRISRAQIRRVLGLGCAFLLSFSIPIVFGYHAVTRYYAPILELPNRRRDLFPGSLRISSQGTYLRIKHDEQLAPYGSDDYLITGWFRLGKLPDVGQRVMLLSKVNPDSAHREGFALGISNDTGTLRPVVYFRDQSGKGGPYFFDEIGIKEGEWFFIAVSVRDGRFIGVHYSKPDRDDRKPGVTLLGGYELEDVGAPITQSDLVIGAWGQNQFRGLIGPLGIYSGSGLEKEYRDLMKDLLREPGKVAQSDVDDALKLYLARWDRDISPANHQVVLIGSQEKSRKGRE